MGLTKLDLSLSNKTPNLPSFVVCRLRHSSTPAAMASSFDEETANKLITQVEFYFSDSNLPRDGFLRKEVSKSKDGLVSLALVCSFSRMRNLLGLGNIKREDIPTRILEEVANLLRTSDFLKVSDNGQRIGRGTKLSKPDKVLEQVHRRTIAASPFEFCIKMEDVASFFSKYAKVNSVRLPHHIGDNKQYFCGTALVEFSSEQEAEDVLRQSLVYSGADLVLVPKSDFDLERENMIKKLGETGPSLSDSSHNEFRRGQLVKFTLNRIANGENVIIKENPKNLENEVKGKEDKAGSAEKVEGNERKEENDSAEQLVVPHSDYDGSEVIKDVFQRFGSVKHIEFSGGSDSGFVCFVDSETAMKARAAVEFVGGIVVKNKFSVVLEAVNGEIEGEVWKRLSSGGRKEEDDKMEKSKGKCPETTQPPKKARKQG